MSDYIFFCPECHRGNREDDKLPEIKCAYCGTKFANNFANKFMEPPYSDQNVEPVQAQ